MVDSIEAPATEFIAGIIQRMHEEGIIAEGSDTEMFGIKDRECYDEMYEGAVFEAAGGAKVFIHVNRPLSREAWPMIYIAATQITDEQFEKVLKGGLWNDSLIDKLEDNGNPRVARKNTYDIGRLMLAMRRFAPDYFTLSGKMRYMPDAVKAMREEGAISGNAFMYSAGGIDKACECALAIADGVPMAIIISYTVCSPELISVKAGSMPTHDYEELCQAGEFRGGNISRYMSRRMGDSESKAAEAIARHVMDI